MPTSGERTLYLASQAIVELVVVEEETAALRAALASVFARVSCTLARVEVVRAVRRKGLRVVADARRVLEGIELIELDDGLLDLAGDLDAPLRALDAIHVAAAIELGDQLGTSITYDARMASPAEAPGLPVAAPA